MCGCASSQVRSAFARSGSGISFSGSGRAPATVNARGRRCGLAVVTVLGVFTVLGAFTVFAVVAALPTGFAAVAGALARLAVLAGAFAVAVVRAGTAGPSVE